MTNDHTSPASKPNHVIAGKKRDAGTEAEEGPRKTSTAPAIRKTVDVEKEKQAAEARMAAAAAKNLELEEMYAAALKVQEEREKVFSQLPRVTKVEYMRTNWTFRPGR